ncbi:MAG: hypothetical protein LBH44_02530 [Treponema sp.]|jgi:RNA polymerase sigma factor (sigma-70 family)|nr:hypothetical protein [Treponema sp.]
MQQSLNDYYHRYTNGLIERSEFEGLVYQYLAKNQALYNFSHWQPEEYEDFISWFYFRLHRAIDAYRDIGASFDAYFKKVIRLTSKEYRVRVTTKKITEYAAWSVKVPELYAYDETPAYLCENAGKKACINAGETPEETITRVAVTANRQRKNPKQLLALLLKCYYYVSDDFLERIAPKIGIDMEQLKEMIEKLKEIRSKRDEGIYNMKERIHCQFYRCIIYEKRLLLATDETTAAVILREKLRKARKRLEAMKKRMTKIRTDATNKQIADVIGISKGTVDSTLHSLKNRWDILTDKSLLN